jgi:hypothetical protein
VKLALLGLLAGCQRLAPFDSGTELFVETLEPDAVHLLATSLPSFDDDPTLLELDLALEPTWSFHREAGGAQGAWRVEDGDTVLAAVTMPPDFSSSIMRIDPQGALVWDHPGLFLAGLGFAHGVVATPEGDWIALDTTGGRLVSFTEEGQELWSYAFDQHGEPGSPNGVAIHRHPEQGALLAVSLLARSSAAGSQQLALLELRGPGEPPVERWRLAVQEREGAAFPHGPRFTEEGELLLCLSSLGQILGLDLDGQERWRLPAAERAAALAFPRDAWFLPDGSLVVADGAVELLRVHDPQGAFELVGATSVPEIFSVHPVICGEGGGLPCLGGGSRSRR